MKQKWFKLIWSKAIPPSKSFIVWRWIHQRLPIDDNLQRRGCHIVSWCSICRSTTKSSNHLFLSCPLAAQIWNWTGNLFSCTIVNSSIEELLDSYNQGWSPQLYEVFLNSIILEISRILNARNNSRFEDKTITNSRIISNIMVDIALSGKLSSACSNSFIEEFSIMRSLSIQLNHRKSPKMVEVTWKCPPIRWTKVNTDGAAFGSPSQADGAGIFRNTNGNFMGCFTDYFEIKDTLYVEFKAALMAVEFAKKKGWNSIWLECDSSLVVDMFKGEAEVSWKLAAKWCRCRTTLSSMDFHVSHIFREGNACVDMLAKFGVNSKTFIWWNDIPSFIHYEFSRNWLALPNYRFKNM
ncbi:PREDICTED: uncharacterized protein LOC109341375 [Lupinus angustifolius]|uniref:uncharacterized protein LOC109341375 n=1 Tax=Lupinus angustifolius TaxID=3871 RepID=UPI00092F9D34|nr:PREDICTED: uncharacterized protein LOC109341375 [Lupinus angustifolius]